MTNRRTTPPLFNCDIVYRLKEIALFLDLKEVVLFHRREEFSSRYCMTPRKIAYLSQGQKTAQFSSLNCNIDSCKAAAFLDERFLFCILRKLSWRRPKLEEQLSQQSCWRRFCPNSCSCQWRRYRRLRRRRLD